MLAARDFPRAFGFRPKDPNRRQGFDPDTLRAQWRAIYALCTPAELEAELTRLQREREALRDCESNEKRARRINRIRRELLRDRMAALRD